MDKLPNQRVRHGEPSFRTNNENMKNEIARLGALDIAGLRLAWRNIFAKSAPTNLPKHLLVRIISYRLQANAYGDLDRNFSRMLVRQAAVAKGQVTAKIRPLRNRKRESCTSGATAQTPQACPASHRGNTQSLPGHARHECGNCAAETRILS